MQSLDALREEMEKPVPNPAKVSALANVTVTDLDDAATVEMWEQVAGRTARDVFYYDVFAGFRFGIIVLRASRRLIELGQLPAEQTFERVNGATTLLAQMLELPSPT